MKGITLLEIAKANSILNKREPNPENIKIAYEKLKKCISVILGEENETKKNN